MRRKREREKYRAGRAGDGRKDERELDLRRDFLGLSVVSPRLVASRCFHIVSLERCREGPGC